MKKAIWLIIPMFLCLLPGLVMAQSKKTNCKLETQALVNHTKAVDAAHKNMRAECSFFRGCKMACRKNQANCRAGKKPASQCKVIMAKPCKKVCQGEEAKPACLKARKAFWSAVDALNTQRLKGICALQYSKP